MASDTPVAGRTFDCLLSQSAPEASAHMLAAEMVSVVRTILISNSPKLPVRIARMPSAALMPTEMIKNHRATFLGLIRNSFQFALRQTADSQFALRVLPWYFGTSQYVSNYCVRRRAV